MSETNISVKVDGQSLDDAIEKANRLAELLREVQQMINSLSKAIESES